MKETVIITGASSGIGLAFAHKFAGNGYHLVLVSRNEAALADLQRALADQYRVKVDIYACDLADMENIDQLFSYLAKEGVVADILINNAGFANYGKFAEVSLTKQMELVDLNIKGLTYMTGRFVEQLVDSSKAKILNVSSIAGLIPGPFISVYAASKSYVYSFSVALSSELKPKGIQVSVLCSGDVKSGFQERAGMKDFSIKMISPDELVDVAFPLFMNGKQIIIPQSKYRLLLSLLKFVSVEKMADKLYLQREMRFPSRNVPEKEK